MMPDFETVPVGTGAKLKAQWQAEALEELAVEFSHNADAAHDNEYHDAADAMKDAADQALERAFKIRRQAGVETDNE